MLRLIVDIITEEFNGGLPLELLLADDLVVIPGKGRSIMRTDWSDRGAWPSREWM